MFESEKDLEISKKAMAWTHILPFSERSIDELSGGERKRVFIARALAQERRSFSSMNPRPLRHPSSDGLSQSHPHSHRERGLSIVMATHI